MEALYVIVFALFALGFMFVGIEAYAYWKRKSAERAALKKAAITAIATVRDFEKDVVVDVKKVITAADMLARKRSSK